MNLGSDRAYDAPASRVALCAFYGLGPSSVSKTYRVIALLERCAALGELPGFGIMALLDLAKRRRAGLSHARRLPNRAVGTNRQQSRGEIAVEVGKTMLILMLVALGIVALRYVLVLAYGVLH
jgi:hypothetical protein